MKRVNGWCLGVGVCLGGGHATRKKKMGFWVRFNLVLLTIAILSRPALSDLIISKVDRRVSVLVPLFRLLLSYNA